MAQTKSIFVKKGNRIPYTSASAIEAHDVVVIGTDLVGVAVNTTAANVENQIDLRGEYQFPKVTGAVTVGTKLYWDNDANPVTGTSGSGAMTTNSSLGPLAAKCTVAADSGDSYVQGILCTGDAATSVARSALGQDDLAPFAITVPMLRVWDAPFTNAVATTGANDDLAVVYNTFGTASPSVETGDLKNVGATTRKVGFQMVVPQAYVPGETITLRLKAGMKTTVASVSATIDAEVYRAAAPTVDICATSATTINSLTAANKDFTITPTNVVPGDVLDIVISIAVNDSGTGTAVIGKWYVGESALLMDIKG